MPPIPYGSKTLLWTGRALSALPVLLCAISIVYSLLRPGFAAGFEHYGYPANALPRITVLETACVVLYAIPRTSALGAILLTGYMGGAIATHVRVGETFFMPVVIGVAVWAGLFLRDERVRALIPLKD